MISEPSARVDHDGVAVPPVSGEETLVVVQSLLGMLGMLREKNLLSRADIEELWHRVEMRAAGHDPSLPCSVVGAASASTAMQRLTSYLGQRYGGKHARSFR